MSLVIVKNAISSNMLAFVSVSDHSFKNELKLVRYYFQH